MTKFGSNIWYSVYKWCSRGGAIKDTMTLFGEHVIVDVTAKGPGSLTGRRTGTGILVWTGLLQERFQRWRRLIKVSDVRTTVFLNCVMVNLDR